MSSLILLIIIAFLTGIYFCAKYSTQYATQEGLTLLEAKKRCPNILIQKDNKFYLYNSKVDKVPGVNPLEFTNLEDYTTFIEWQRSQGIRCPVLFLQQSYDAQGNRVYKSRPAVDDLQGGLPPALAINPSAPESSQMPNVNIDPNLVLTNYKTHDNEDISEYTGYAEETIYKDASITPADKIQKDLDNLTYSPNPMDTNWGGSKYTQNLIDKGYYAGNEVALRV